MSPLGGLHRAVHAPSEGTHNIWTSTDAILLLDFPPPLPPLPSLRPVRTNSHETHKIIEIKFVQLILITIEHQILRVNVALESWRWATCSTWSR